jgi:hypothetical protein
MQLVLAMHDIHVTGNLSFGVKHQSLIFCKLTLTATFLIAQK